MGAQTRIMSDDSVRYDNFVEAKKLFNYGFSNFAYAKIAMARISPMYPVSVEYAKDKRGVVLIPSTDVSCLLPKEYEKDKVTTSYKLNDPKGLTAPLEQGQKVGTLYVSYEGTIIGSTDLETLTAVEELPVDKAIADITGKDTPDEEKTAFQRIISYWYIPFLLIGGLILILVLRNFIYRYRRKKAIERRRRRAISRDARYAQRQRREAQTRKPNKTADMEPTIRISTNNRGGRP